MSEERVSVGSSYKETIFGILVGGAAIGIIGGLSLFVFSPEWAIGVTGAGLIFGMLALARGYAISRKRRWITPTDEGFLLGRVLEAQQPGRCFEQAKRIQRG